LSGLDKLKFIALEVEQILKLSVDSKEDVRESHGSLGIIIFVSNPQPNFSINSLVVDNKISIERNQTTTTKKNVELYK
jgi:hypothetical protein